MINSLNTKYGVHILWQKSDAFWGAKMGCLVTWLKFSYIVYFNQHFNQRNVNAILCVKPLGFLHPTSNTQGYMRKMVNFCFNQVLTFNLQQIRNKVIFKKPL